MKIGHNKNGYKCNARINSALEEDNSSSQKLSKAKIENISTKKYSDKDRIKSPSKKKRKMPTFEDVIWDINH